MITRLAGCPICSVLDNAEARVLETPCWDVRLGHQQMRPGRCMTILKRHAGRETDLTEAEWLDLRGLRQQLHAVLLVAFGATHLNTSLLMNGAFKNYGTALWGRSHVHYWDVPRYRTPVVIGGVTFDDPGYPSFNPGEFGSETKVLSAEIRNAILHRLRQLLTGPAPEPAR